MIVGESPDSILIRYGELGLKDNNRGLFERQLQSNLANKLSSLPYRYVERFQGGMRVHLSDESPVERICARLRRVPGIAWFAPGWITERDPDAIADRILEKFHLVPDDLGSLAVRTQRSDKSLELNSMDYNRILGEKILESTGFTVNLDNPDLTVHVHVLFSDAHIFFQKIDGFGGLPVESSGEVLSLLSGGIDSPVASILAMKRGCRVDFLHYYPYATVEEAQEKKIKSIVGRLNNYQTHGRLFMAPYHVYDLHGAPVPERKELLLFRRHMTRVASRIADEFGHRALVTGESVGQVASQTLENINTVQQVTDKTILRPLIEYDKQDIVDLSKDFGTYHLSIREYQDCCSIQTSRTETRTRPGNLREIEQKHNLLQADEEVYEAITLHEFSGSDLTETKGPPETQNAQ